MQAAEAKAKVEGDFAAAIKLYKNAEKEAGSNRALVAQALVKMAEAYQTIGEVEAQKIYQRLVRDFSDQKDVSATAAERLALMTPARTRAEGIVATKILEGPEADVYGSISRDGRYVSFMDPETLDLAVRDLVTNEKRRLTTHSADSKNEFAEYSVFSADGSRLAYGWHNRDNKYELRTISREGGASTLLFSNGEWLMPYDWSPDGREILTLIMGPNRTRQLALISSKDGSRRALKTLDWNQDLPIHAEYSPDGRFIAYERNEGETKGDVFVIASDGSQETTITRDASGESVLGWFPDGRSLLMSSDRAGSVGAWAVEIRDGRPHGSPTLVKPDIGDIRPYRFTKSRGFVYTLRVGVPDIQIATIDPGTGQTIAGPTPLPQRPPNGRGAGLWSPDGTRVMYRINPLLLGVQDVTSGAVRTIPIKLNYAARPSWTPDGESFMVQGTNLNARNGIFRVDSAGSAVPLPGEMVIGFGPIAVSRAGASVYYKRAVDEQGGSHTGLIRREIASGEEREIRAERTADTSLFALSRDGRSLALRINNADGTRSFEVMPAGGGESRTILRERDSEALWGGGYFAWSSDDRYLFVVRAPVETSTGAAALGVWRIPVAGGAPQPLALTAPGINGVDVSPDGRQLLLETLDVRREVWSLQNLPSLVR
jgi:dipeptidyl aminopeptidase/acylaminoacyl peptidase